MTQSLDGIQCHDHLNRCAVWVSYDSARADEGIGSINLWHDQRDILLHTEGTGIVDHHSTVLGDRLCILDGYTSPSRDEGDINILEVISVL